MGTPANVVVLPQDTATLRIEEINLPDPGPTQVVVKEYASGICHSQLHHCLLYTSDAADDRRGV